MKKLIAAALIVCAAIVLVAWAISRHVNNKQDAEWCHENGYTNYATKDGFCVGAGGKLIKVGRQYTDTQVRKTPTNITWRGTQFRAPRKTMVGTFDYKAARYVEVVYGGNRIETKTTARCTVVDSNVGKKISHIFGQKILERPPESERSQFLRRRHQPRR